METGEPFSDFFNIPTDITDNGHEPQGDFLTANFNLQHQEDLLWDLSPSVFGQNLENQFVDGQAFNNNALNEQIDFLLPPPPTPSKPRRHRLNKVQKTCLNNWLIAHQSDPYPTSEEIKALAAETLLSDKQVRTWFNNARTRNGLQGKPLPSMLTKSTVFDRHS